MKTARRWSKEEQDALRICFGSLAATVTASKSTRPYDEKLVKLLEQKGHRFNLTQVTNQRIALRLFWPQIWPEDQSLFVRKLVASTPGISNNTVADEFNKVFPGAKKTADQISQFRARRGIGNRQLGKPAPRRTSHQNGLSGGPFYFITSNPEVAKAASCFKDMRELSKRELVENILTTFVDHI